MIFRNICTQTHTHSRVIQNAHSGDQMKRKHIEVHALYIDYVKIFKMHMEKHI